MAIAASCAVVLPARASRGSGVLLALPHFSRFLAFALERFRAFLERLARAGVMGVERHASPRIPTAASCPGVAAARAMRRQSSPDVL